MFWYDTTTASGEWSEGLELDHYFNDVNTSWASMRSSWTDNDGLYVAMKASTLMGHQTRKFESIPPFFHHSDKALS